MTTKIVDDRECGLAVGYEATDWSVKIPFEQYAEGLKDWTVKTLVKNDQPIGALYTKDGELHVSIKPEWRRKWFTKSLYFELFVGKKVTTKVTEGHEYMYDILHRIGFRNAANGMMVKD